MKKPELIAPAGNLRKLKYAFAHGADAVYLGVPNFSLRARNNDFNLTRLKSGIKYAHDMGKKVYVTVNLYAHDRHLRGLESFVKQVNRNTEKQKNRYLPDAFVVSDPGVLRIVKKHCPKIPIHLSTQANTTNWQAAKFWYDQGVSRIILARELSLKEIAVIHKKVPKLELETFVHGAMCMAYSGRCILSKWLTGRSANLGDCAHACRWKYKGLSTKYQEPSTKFQNYKQVFVEEAERPGEMIPVEEDQHGTYIFNSKDLCLIDHLSDLEKAGVRHFKIEGRAKSIFYLTVVIKAYRDVIDEKQEAGNMKHELKKLVNRGYHTGFLFGKDKFEHLFDKRQVGSKYMFVGEVIGCPSAPPRYTRSRSGSARTKAGYNILVRVHNVLKVGDRVEAIVPGGENVRFVVKSMVDVDTEEEVKVAHGGREQRVFLDVKHGLPEYTVLRKVNRQTGRQANR